VTTDCKEYRENGERFSVAQIEEVGFNQFWKRKDELLAALENFRRAKNFLFSALMVTDVVGQQSLMLVASEKSSLTALIIPNRSPAYFNCSTWFRGKNNCCRISRIVCSG